MYSHLQYFSVLFYTIAAIYQIYLLCDIMSIKSVLLILFFLSDSDEDPLPPKIRYFDTHMEQICISVSFNASVGLYIRAGSRRSSPASLPCFAGYFHCFTSKDMLRR